MDEELIFRASLQDNASPGLDQLRQKAQQTGQAVGQSGAAGASGLDVLNRSMSKSVGAANQFAAGSTSALGRFNAASNQAATVSTRSSSKIAAGFKRAAIGIVGAFGLMQVAMSGWKRLTSIEDAEAKLRGLGNSAADVSVIMANALAAVKGTAFGLDEAATAAAGAVAAGIKPGKQLETVLKAVANGAAAANIGMGEMGAIFNKVASLGKAQNDVLQQVANQGLPIYQALAEQFGVTADQVFKMATKGQIGFEQFEKAMTAAAGTVADEMGKTTSGTIRNMGAALSRFGALMMATVQPLAKSVFGTVTESVDGLGKSVSALFTGVATVAGPFVHFWSSLPGPIKAVSAALLILVAFHSPLLRLFTALGSPIRGIVANLRGMTAGFTGAAAAVGSFGWQMQLLQMRSGITGTAGMSKIGSFFTVAGRQAKAFGKSLLGAVGGPAGLAVVGAITAVTYAIKKMGEAQQWAKDKADQHKASLDAIGDAFGQSKDFGSEQVRTSASQALQDAKWGWKGDWDWSEAANQNQSLLGLIDATGGAFSQSDMINATLGDSAAQAKINAAIDAAKGKMIADAAASQPHLDMTGAPNIGWGNVNPAAQAAVGATQSDEYRKLTAMGDAMANLYDSNVKAALDSINKSAGVANVGKTYTLDDVKRLVDTGAAKDYNDALEQIAKTIDTTTDATKDLDKASQDALNKAADGTKRWQDATEAARKSIYDAMTSPPSNPIRDEWASIADATKDATDQAKTYQRLMDEMRGRPVALDDALQVFNDSNRALKEAAAAGTKSTKGHIESLIGKDGRINTTSEAGSKLRTDLRTWADQSATLVTAAYNDAITKGMTSDEANAAAQKAADTRLKAFRDAMAASKVEAPTVEAMIKDLGLDQPVKSIYGPAALAQAQAGLVDAMTSAAKLGQEAAERAGKSSEEAIQAGIQSGVEAAADWVDANGIDAIPVDLDTDPAYAAYGGLKAMVQQAITARVVLSMGMSPYVNTPEYIEKQSNSLLARALGANPSHQARGSITQAASGLVRNAMIARGGSNILWAEPETDWEAYIPGAAKNRARSEALMDVVARRFGGMYTPAAAIAKPMADGGITGASSRPAAPGITVGPIHVDARGATDPQAVGEAVRKGIATALREDRERSM